MNKFLIALLASLSLSGSVFAILPPLWQNVSEIKAILDNKELGNKLQSGEIIEEIKKNDNGWIIITNHNELAIKIVYHKPAQPGPALFTLEFGNPSRRGQ